MTEQHDEALVERVARAFYTERGFTSKSFDALQNKEHWIEAARAVIYPPAPPKTRLQVATDIWREAGGKGQLIHDTVAGKAILAALALPAMED